jgi:hypothetical protein
MLILEVYISKNYDGTTLGLQNGQKLDATIANQWLASTHG